MAEGLTSEIMTRIVLTGSDGVRTNWATKHPAEVDISGHRRAVALT
jgi:hypothetical protein